MTPETKPVCVVCNEPASSRCSACKSATYIRHYCGKVCQANDWPAHKKACKELQNLRLERALMRVTEIAQQAFYDFRNNTWDTTVTKILNKADGLVMYQGNGYKDANYFLKFPDRLAKNVQTKNAILCVWVCEESSAWMHNLISGLVTGLDLKVEEVEVYLGRVDRKITVREFLGSRRDNWPKYSHSIVCFSSIKTGKQWALDLSGAQYGIHTALWSLEDYKKQYAAKVRAVYPLGTYRDLMRKLGDIPGNPTMMYGVVGTVAEHLNLSIENWVCSRGFSLAEMIDLPGNEYEEAKASLLESMSNSVRSFIATNDFQAKFKEVKIYEKEHPGKSGQERKAMTKGFFLTQLQSITGTDPISKGHRSFAGTKSTVEDRQDVASPESNLEDIQRLARLNVMVRDIKDVRHVYLG